ncbi:MAG: hypothetical protein V1894_04250 [Chloroflexota bacterium]
MTSEENEKDVRQIRRAERLRKRREQMKRHGGSLFTIYRNAVTKRLKKKPDKKP